MAPARLPSLLDPPLAFAHRGARAHAPENTLEAFRLALRLGATGLESDVWLSADGVPVLDHDGVVRVGRRKRAITTVRRADLPAHIPDLAEVLALCGAEVHLSLDLKGPAAVGREVVALLAGAPAGLRRRTWLCAPEWRTVDALRRLDPDVRLVDSTRLRLLKEGLERRLARLAERGIDALNLHHSDWTGGSVALAHRFGRLAFAWDLQHPPALTATLAMGVDAVYSDHVDRMVDAVRGERPGEPG